jgi:ATP/maltotriose-dependent transcriptional regulator MalT
MVGRGAERARLAAALDRTVHERHGGTSVISGEPGIGKTSLLTEVGRHALRRGCLVLAGLATEFERDIPLAVFADALDGRLDTILAEAAGSAAPDRLATHAMVRESLSRLANSRPVVLLLDDLHWADAASIDLFGYLSRHPPRGPVLTVAALRPAQSPPRLRYAVRIPHRELDVLELGPLSRAEVAHLLSDVDPTTVAELFAESGGNPFYLNALRRADRSAPAVRGDRADVPAPVLAALSAELAALPVTAQHAAWGAAVAGDPFEVDLAAVVAGLDTPIFLAALDELIVADLFRPTDLPRRYRFRHPIVRHAVYAAAGHGWRLAAHGRAAAALAATGAPPLSRAHHVEYSAATGDPAAAALLTEAGHAASRHAPDAAAHWFTAALRLLPESERHAARRAELLAPLALTAGAAGQFDTSRRAIDELLTLVPAEMAPIRVELVAFRAFLDHVTGRADDARALVEQELAMLTDEQAAERAALHIELASNALVRSDHRTLAEHGWQALRQAGHSDRAPLMVAAGALAAFADYTEARIDEARATLATAAARLDAIPDDVLATRLDAALLLAHAEYNLERHADTIRHASRGLALAGSGHALLTPILYVTRACGHAFSGHIDAAITDAATAYEASALTGSDWTASVARGISSWVHVWRGDLTTALRHADEALELGAATGSAMTTSNVGLFRAEALLESGRPGEVGETLLSAVGGTDLPLLERPWRARAYQVLIRAALAMADHATARTWLNRATSELSGLALPRGQAYLRYAQAAFLLGTRDHPGAIPVALASVAAAQQGGAPVEEGRARILAGIAMAGAGRRSDGIAELLRARGQLDALGANRYRDQATRELRRLGRRVTAYAPARQPGELSTREHQIAELVATGITNRQIAATLVISEKTVETHVSRILGKLNVSSRAAIGRALVRT